MTRVSLITLFVMTFAAALPAGTNLQPDAKLQAVKRQGQSGAQRNRPNIIFILADDPYEKKNLAESNHDKVKELRARYDRLASQAVPPKIKPKAADFKSPKIWGEQAPPPPKSLH